MYSPKIKDEYIGEKINSCLDVGKILWAILDSEDEVNRDKEHFWVIGLTTKNTVKFIDLVSLGTLSNSLIHPRETFRRSIIKGIASIIVGHNHPSGDPTPSREDLVISERLKSAGEIIGITLLDHVIIGEKEKCISLKEKGHL